MNQKVSPARANQALLYISLAVLMATSTWFSGTAATPALKEAWHLSHAQVVWLTIAVQLGFIVGTFVYAIFNIADVFNARYVYATSALLTALFNAGFAIFSQGLPEAIVLRFFTGLTLAGVYPVGMKIVAAWFQSGLGWRLGIMVGALTLGTAFPFFLQSVGADFDWRWLVLLASAAATLGGIIMLAIVKDGPYLKKSATFNAKMMFRMFAHKAFRLTALGYFGHMWELYAFWALITFYLGASFKITSPELLAFLPLLGFLAIAMGTLGCVGGGWVSKKVGERRVAFVSLCVSAGCCGLSGFAFGWSPFWLLPLVLLWGVFVVADSPQFSALATRFAPKDYVGTALTVQNGIGFGLTVLSIQLLPLLAAGVGWQWAFVFLLPGPLAGAVAMAKLGKLN